MDMNTVMSIVPDIAPTYSFTMQWTTCENIKFSSARSPHRWDHDSIPGLAYDIHLCGIMINDN